jgi:hypothetical protein
MSLRGDYSFTQAPALIILAKEQNLCAELGFKDFADWVIRGHNMSERTAYRKMKAARLSQSVPGVLEKIENGQLSITKAVQVQSAIQTHEKFAYEKLSVDYKAEISRLSINLPNETLELIKRAGEILSHSNAKRRLSARFFSEQKEHVNSSIIGPKKSAAAPIKFKSIILCQKR